MLIVLGKLHMDESWLVGVGAGAGRYGFTGKDTGAERLKFMSMVTWALKRQSHDLTAVRLYRAPNQAPR